MGIFDFLGDLSSKRSKELGLGGLQSLLGTRGAAQAGAIGDEMISITNKDSLPGYFNEQTREYVPWYVDLFDGGGLNASGTVAEQEAAQSMAARTMPGSAPMAQPGLLANNQLSDMERANRSRVGVDPRNLGGAEGYGPMPARDPRNLGGAEGYGPMGQSMPAPQQGVLPQMQDNVPMSTPAPFTAKYESTPRLSEMQTPMMQHPAFPKFVELMKRQGHGSSLQDPRFLQTVFNNYLRLEGL